MESSSVVFIKNLPYGIGEREIKVKFDVFGEIKSINPKNGFCFIEYVNESSAKDAIKELDGKIFDGRSITVQPFEVKNGRPYEKRGPLSDDVCKNCQEKGHWAYQCPSEKRQL